MTKKHWFYLVALALLGILPLLAYPVTASPDPQVVYQTPTARPDGRVIYKVQEGDSCLRIELLTGVTIDTLRTLNKLDQNCTVVPGQELLLMIVTPVASATPDPNIAATPEAPTATPQKGSGRICVLLYDDINGDAMRETTELPLAGGAVSITSLTGDISRTLNTTASEDPLCEEVLEGKYSISMAIPSGYNPTVAMTSEIQVQAGEQVILEYGAQISTKAPEEPAGGQDQQGGSNNNLMLVLMGGLFVALGIGLGGYILFTRRAG